MLRFIIKNKKKTRSGALCEHFYTIDLDIPELEKALDSGGLSETEYEVHSLVGVEIVYVPGANKR